MSFKQNPKRYSIEMCREQLKSVLAEKTKLRQHSAVDCQVAGLAQSIRIFDFLSQHSKAFKEYAGIIDASQEKKRDRLNLTVHPPRSSKKLNAKSPLPEEKNNEPQNP
jgi:hypothetical protein